MARQIIKTTAHRFETIQEGHQTCVILKNDRLWTTYDELWFVECDKNNEPTGRVVRANVGFIEGGGDVLQPAHSLVHFRALGRRREELPVETTTKGIITAVMQESYETLLMPGKPRQVLLD